MLTDHQSVEPGFHIVQSPISRAALETLLFGQPDPAVLEKFRQLNSQLPERLRPGHLVVLSHPDNNLCTREESLLMEAAEKVSIELESLTDEETTFMLQYRSQVASILAYSGTATGVGTAAIGSHVNELKGTLQDIERLHQTFFQRDGHLRSAEFFSERRKLFTRLDSQLIGITKMSVAFPEHQSSKAPWEFPAAAWSTVGPKRAQRARYRVTPHTWRAFQGLPECLNMAAGSVWRSVERRHT